MAKKKKVNPYRIPATQGDIEKAKRDATNTAVASTWAIMFSVLRDKEGYDYDRLRRIWDEQTTSQTVSTENTLKSTI